MKTRFSKVVRFLCVLYLPIWVAAQRGFAQTPAQLDIQLYPGLSIAGSVGTVYSIEYGTDLAQTNAWHCLAFLQLPTTNYLWTDTSTPAMGRRFYRAVATAPTNLVFIPPGTFRLGSPTNEIGRNDNEGPQTAVTLTKGFFMGKYVVTQGDYLAVVGRNPSFFNGIRNGTDYGIDLTRPVEQVTWFEATNYCALRTQQESFAGLIPAGSQYRLPTEAEWEYACRAWTSTRFSYGDDPDYTNLTDYGWYADNSGDMTHPAGQKLPNLWGLYDMDGNVGQWCQDWFGQYHGGSVADPQGPVLGSLRVLHGGAFGSFASGLRPAFRFGFSPAAAASGLGFRVVLAPRQP